MLKTLTPLQKIMVIFFIVLTFLSITHTCFAISGSGSGTWDNEQYNSSIRTTDNIDSPYGMFMRSLINEETGERITVFCSEHGVGFTTGKTYDAEYYKPTSSTMIQACKVAYFGWYSKYGSYSDFNELFAHKYDYLFTQQYMWEILGQSNATFIDSSTQSEYETFKAEIDSKISNIQIQPSFSGTTIETEVGNTITLTDTNEVLSGYKTIDNTIDGISIMHNHGENTLSLAISSDCTLESYSFTENIMKDLGLVKEETIDNDTTLYFLFPDNVQDQLYSMHYNEPVALSINLSIFQYGKLELIKANTDGTLLDGAVFNITGPDDFNKDITVKGGKIVLDNLKKGTYYIKEKSAPEGYLIDKNVYEVEIEPNKLVTKTITNNEKPKGNIVINKSIEQIENIDTILVDTNDLSKIQFSLSAKENIVDPNDGKIIYKKDQEIKKYNLDKKGKLAINDLPLGTYNLQETKTIDGVILDETIHEVKLSKDSSSSKLQTKTLNLKNIPTFIEISKIDFATGEELEGAKLQLIDENGKIVDEWISSKQSHKISGLIEGKQYKLIEILPPEGYEKAEEITFTFSKEMQKVEMKDKPIIKEAPKTGDESNKDFLIGIILFSILNLLILKIYSLKFENELINKNDNLEK